MRGIELAKAFFWECGLPMLEREFPNELPRIAAGLAGRGSECFGFDDEISRDHDFKPGFALWIAPEDERKFGFRLLRAYRSLPMEFHGVRLQKESACGFCEHGPCAIPDFFERHIGIPCAPRTWMEWLRIPDCAFAEATNGAVFRDDAGAFSRIRNSILHDMPEDVRLKKMAARAAFMAHSGQYNFSRCEKRGERGAAFLALAEFARNAVPLIFLLNRSFAPYEKWMFRAMRALPLLGSLADSFEALLAEPSSPSEKSELIERICVAVANEMRRQGVSDSSSDYMENHAFSMTSRIRNREIRTMHVMDA